MIKIEWTQSAIADLTAIYELIAEDSPRHAIGVVDRLTNRTIQLADFPESGHMVPEYQRDDIREVIEYSYRMLYHIDNATVSIVAVIHGAHPLPEALRKM